ncbi:MAG: hypothetical protein ACI4F4_09645 [Lachnospiraceae bacterium]
MIDKLKKILSCIMVICLTVCLLVPLTNVMERKSSDVKYADFFKQEEDFDVLFMGTSHVINGIFPMELWNSNGIVSYNLGGHSNMLATTYWTMENAFDYTTPKVVVIDCFTLSNNWKCSDEFAYMHLSLDAFPISKTKLKAIWDLSDDPILEEALSKKDASELGEPRTKIGLLWDYSVYHSRWNALEENDFNVSPNLEKGAESRIRVSNEKLNRIDPGLKMEAGTVGEEYLRKMIEDCQSRGIEVLLTYLPFPGNKGRQMESNYAYDIAKEYGVNYINFLDMDLVDYQTDFYDENHLNPSGARKITKYIGDYLVEHYQIPDRRTNTDYQYWYEDYEEYEAFKNDNLRAQENVIKYLMLLSDDNVDVVLDMKDKNIVNNDTMIKMLCNLGIDANQLSEKTDFIIVKNKGKDIVVLDDFRQEGLEKETEIGNITYQIKDKQYELFIDGVSAYVGNFNDKTNLGVKVLRSGQVVDEARFKFRMDGTEVEMIKVNRP